MANRAYLSSDRNTIGARTLNGSVATANGGARGPPAFAPTKAQQYGPTRLPYRPPTRPPPRRRGCCCACCLWLTLLLIALVFLVALAAGVFYVLYHPQHPNFSVDSLHLSALNLAVTDWNSNRKIVFLYDDVAISADDDVAISAYPDECRSGRARSRRSSMAPRTPLSSKPRSRAGDGAGSQRRRRI